jgi:acetylglutamate kinase
VRTAGYHLRQTRLSMAANPKARVLAEALPYIRAYHGKMLVIRFGGHAMADAALKAGFARDVALLHSVGMKPIVVHGGGWRIDELMQQMGMQSRRYGGVRITDERTLTVIEMALDELNQELTGLINTRGGRAVGLNGQDGRFIHARQKSLPPDEAGEAPPDLGFVGDIESIDTDLMYLLLSQNFIPVIMPIGVGADGAAYHINSDLLAGRLARTLEAEKLILMTNVPGVRDRSGNLAYILTASDAEKLLAEGVVEGGMRPRVTAALQAVREGVRSVHIIDGGVPSALLLEVLTAEGVGTALRSDSGPHFLEDSRGYLLAQ